MMLLSLAEDFAMAATASAAGMAVLADAALRPQSQLFGSTLVAPNRPDEIAFTYDDGPNDVSTPRLLDLFAEYDVRATFFMIGRYVRQQPALARRVLAEGHVVANHTMTHPWLAWQSGKRIREEMRGCNAVLEDVLGARIEYFRPPHGARRPAVFREARELGLQVVQWNVMGMDWRPIGAGGILGNVRDGMKAASEKGVAANVLLHDGSDISMGADRSDTVAATAHLLALTKANGMKAVGVDAWKQEIGNRK